MNTQTQTKPEDIQIARDYQLGGASVFAVARDGTQREVLLKVIAKDARRQRDNGDEQGIRYSVTTEDEARALGCYESVTGAWIVEGTEQQIEIVPA